MTTSDLSTSAATPSRMSSASSGSPAAHVFRRLERERAGEHGEPAKQTLLALVEERVAPLHRARAACDGAEAPCDFPPSADEMRRRAGRAICSGDSTRTRAAASSIASGMPSSRRQISRERQRVGCRFSENDGIVACARSTNSCTASRAGERRNEPRRLARDAERLATRRERCGAADSCAAALDERRAAVDDVLAVVEHDERVLNRRSPRSTESTQRRDRCDRGRAARRDLLRDERRVGRAARRSTHPMRPKSPTACAASSRARRVLPLPPAPVSVSSRVPESSRASSFSSASRPTKRVR